MWAWALWKARQQQATVTWFHYDGIDDASVVIDGVRNCIFTGGSSDKSKIDQSLGTILIVDGVTLDESRNLSRACTRWYKQRNRTGMFILVSSQPKFVPCEQNLPHRIATHVVCSWVETDYLRACQDPTFLML